MSEPDPMDKAYAEAEAMLSDDAARAARRARVLAAVAAAPPAEASPARSPGIWRRGGALAAAGLAGLVVLVATQVHPPAPLGPPAPTRGGRHDRAGRPRNGPR